MATTARRFVFSCTFDRIQRELCRVFLPWSALELLETATNAAEQRSQWKSGCRERPCSLWDRIPHDLPNCKSSHSQAMRDSLLRHVLMLLLTPPREDIPSIRANWVSWALVTWLYCGDVGPERSIPCMMFSTVHKVCGAWLERAGFLH